MDVITQPTLINIVYPIEVFDFHQLIFISDIQGVGIAPSMFLVASVECLLQFACVLERSSPLRVIDISQPLLKLQFSVPIHSQNFQNLAYTSTFTVLPLLLHCTSRFTLSFTCFYWGFVISRFGDFYSFVYYCYYCLFVFLPAIVWIFFLFLFYLQYWIPCRTYNWYDLCRDRMPIGQVSSDS